jgi:hypothetical protein
MARDDQWTSFEEHLHRAILESGESQLEISQRTGVSTSSLSRFLLKERGLTSWSVGKLTEHLRLGLVPTARLQSLAAELTRYVAVEMEAEGAVRVKPSQKSIKVKGVSDHQPPEVTKVTDDPSTGLP